MRKKVDSDEVLKLHSMGYSMEEVCLRLTTTEYYVYKILKSNGLRFGTKVERLKEKYNDIIKSYKQTHKLSEVANEFNVSTALVDKILKVNGVPQQNRDQVNVQRGVRPSRTVIAPLGPPRRNVTPSRTVTPTGTPSRTGRGN